jgi:hypothetical protein
MPLLAGRVSGGMPDRCAIVARSSTSLLVRFDETLGLKKDRLKA